MLNKTEAANYLGVSRATIYRFITEGKLSNINMLIPKAEVIALRAIRASEPKVPETPTALLRANAKEVLELIANGASHLDIAKQFNVNTGLVAQFKFSYNNPIAKQAKAKKRGFDLALSAFRAVS